MATQVVPMNVETVSLLKAVTGTGAGSAVTAPRADKQYQANGTTSSGAGAATINVEGTLNGSDWDVIATINLTLGTSSSSGGFPSNDRYSRVRGNVTAISGTDASVNLVMGY